MLLTTNNCRKVSESSKTEESAGYDWYTGFMDRNKTLSFRTAEATTINRAINLNKYNVKRYVEDLEKKCMKKKNWTHGVGGI